MPLTDLSPNLFQEFETPPASNLCIYRELESNKEDDLNKFSSEIIELLTGEIVSRYYYQKGRIIANLQFDKDVKEAIGVLQDKKRYDNILAGTSK